MEPQASAPQEIRGGLPTPDRDDRLHIRLLGGMDIQSNGVPLRRTRSRTEKWLLALLLLRANQSVERSWLAGLFWPESREAQALNNLRRSLSNLRGALGEEAYRLLTPSQHTVAFDLADAFCDVTAFDNALARKDIGSLRRAVELYRGPLLPECHADWILIERRVREQAFLTALETLAAQAIQDGEAAEAVGFLRQALQIEPFRETTQRCLLEALASVGDKAGMTLAYRQLRLRLHDELQTEPSSETTALYQRLRDRVSQQGATASVPPSRPASAPPIPTTSPLRIPWPISELVGREAETEEVASLLTAHRLITLTGSGGIGKTRLALAVAARAARDFPDGVWFVDLSSVTEAAQVLPTVARALEMREPSGDHSPAEALRKHLEGRRLLLILDNAEHLRESCAALTAALLETLPELQALVTSRMPLGIAGEQHWRVPSLPVPDPAMAQSGPLADSLLEYAGSRLFVTRALAASSAFVVTDQNAPFILQTCTRLDGIPLALELAAARVASLSPEQIAARLEDAFRLLTTGSHTALPRHQTLRAMVDWSYALLTETQQRAFRQFACFVGGWTLEAAEAFSGDDAPDLLAGMIGQSLVSMETLPDGQTRYCLLETLRQYGMEKLREAGEEEQARARHRRYFLRFARENTPDRSGADQALAMARLEADYDNLRIALEGCLAEMASPFPSAASPAKDGLDIAAALWRIWEARGEATTGRAFLAALLAHPDTGATTPARAGALNGAGMLARLQSDYEAAYYLLEQSLFLYQELNDREGESRVCGSMGVTRLRQGDDVAADALLKRSLTLQRKINDRWGMALTLGNLGASARRRGEYPQAIVFLEESLALRKALNDREGIAHVMCNLGTIRYEQGDYAAARRFQEECLALNRAVGNKTDVADSLNDLSLTARAQGDYPQARLLLEESLTLRRATGDRWGTALALGNLGGVALQEGDYPRARALQEESLALRRAVNDHEGIGISLANLGDQAHFEGDFDRAFTLHGESLVVLRAQNLKFLVAHVLMNLGEDCLELHRWGEAHGFFTECLNLSQEIGSQRLIPGTLDGFARLSLDRQPERAAILYGSTTVLRKSLVLPRSSREQRAYDQAQIVLRDRLPETVWISAVAWGANLSLAQSTVFALGSTDLPDEDMTVL
jgi:predicted ATPase/DNA-binding SARP family transcriptional activator/uncharacterized protein HemY